jgi:phage terminase small subunit
VAADLRHYRIAVRAGGCVRQIVVSTKRKRKQKAIEPSAIIESDGLTIKQRLFIDHYITCMNGTTAARLAGYDGDDSTLAVMASQNLRNHNILRVLEQRLEKYTMSANEVLIRLTDMARGDIADTLDSTGQISLQEAKLRARSHLVKRYKHKRKTITTTDDKGDNGSEILEDEYEVEMYDAQAALNTLLKFHGLLVDRVKVEDWRSEIIGLLKDGKISPEQVRKELGDGIAEELFNASGLSITVERESKQA